MISESQQTKLLSISIQAPLHRCDRVPMASEARRLVFKLEAFDAVGSVIRGGA
jgi:hypothetical protein